MNYKLNFFYNLSQPENIHRLVIHSQEAIYQVKQSHYRPGVAQRVPGS
jgi:hypothetical protein